MWSSSGIVTARCVIDVLRATSGSVSIHKETNAKTNHHKPKCKSWKYCDRNFERAGSFAIPGHAVCRVRNGIHGVVGCRRRYRLACVD